MTAAIIGAGLMGRWHAHALERLGYAVSAVIDPDLGRATQLARRYRNAKAAVSLDATNAVDVVHVCTPLASHLELARKAIARGAHVIVEKPLAPGAAETSALMAEAAGAGRLLVPVHQFLFQRGVRQAIDRLDAVGPLLHLEFAACTAGAAGKGDAEQDRVAAEVLPHPLSLMARLVSPEIAKVDWTVKHTRPGELRADGVLDGVCATILVSTGGRPTTNQLRLIGERGTIAIDLYHGFAEVSRGRATRGGKLIRPFVGGASLLAAASLNLARRGVAREFAYPGLRELLGLFYHAVATDGPAPISMGETVAVAQALESIQALMGSHRPATPRPASPPGARGAHVPLV